MFTPPQSECTHSRVPDAPTQLCAFLWKQFKEGNLVQNQQPPSPPPPPPSRPKEILKPAFDELRLSGKLAVLQVPVFFPHAYCMGNNFFFKMLRIHTGFQE